jgi:hypothetical protein
MSSVSSNFLPFSVGLILGNKKKSRWDKSGEYGNDLILESVLPTTALLIMQCEVSRRLATGTSFLLPKTEILLDEFVEANETILPLPLTEESFDDQLKSIHPLRSSP